MQRDVSILAIEMRLRITCAGASATSNGRHFNYKLKITLHSGKMIKLKIKDHTTVYIVKIDVSDPSILPRTKRSSSDG